VQLETDQVVNRLNQLIGKMHDTKQQFDQESRNSQTSSIAKKVDLISQSNILNIKAQ
jgi:hypothetical protein